MAAVFSGRKIAPQTSKPGSDTNMAPGQSGADWTEVFNELKNAVKMRHYSPKTLKTYSGWVRKLQTYTKSKDPRLVSIDDVKAFLTWLAVDQDISASSQNQAFNALLFLFRNVFGNCSRNYNAHFTAIYRTVSVYRVLQMRGVRVRRRTSCTSSARQQSRCSAL